MRSRVCKTGARVWLRGRRGSSRCWCYPSGWVGPDLGISFTSRTPVTSDDIISPCLPTTPSLSLGTKHEHARRSQLCLRTPLETLGISTHSWPLWDVYPFRKVYSFPFRSDQLLIRVQLFVTPWIAAHQASLSITNSRSSLRLMSVKSVMLSSHLILCRPLLLLPPIPPSIRVFSSYTPIQNKKTLIFIYGSICNRVS